MKIEKRKYKPKRLNFDRICRYCGNGFKAADVKCYTCVNCKAPRECKCGCGKMIKTPGHWFASGCNTRGKTYLEIYGTDNPKCGFKSGPDNPMANQESLDKVLKRINKGVAYNNIWFRSSYEVAIYKLIETENVLYEPTLSVNGVLYKPDFVVGENIIEVSGYASCTETGRLRNIKKINDYLNYTNYNIIFITNKKFMQYYEQQTNNRFKLLEYESTIHNKKRFI